MKRSDRINSRERSDVPEGTLDLTIAHAECTLPHASLQKFRLNEVTKMTATKGNHPLIGETLITLPEAAKDFAGIEIPLNTVKRYVYQGVKGLKLETISVNGRYTSKEAILRFIDRKQGNQESFERPKVKRMSSKEVEESLRRHGIIK